jgi:hypothetical protein
MSYSCLSSAVGADYGATLIADTEEESIRR